MGKMKEIYTESMSELEGLSEGEILNLLADKNLNITILKKVIVELLDMYNEDRLFLPDSDLIQHAKTILKLTN